MKRAVKMEIPDVCPIEQTTDVTGVLAGIFTPVAEDGEERGYPRCGILDMKIAEKGEQAMRAIEAEGTVEQGCRVLLDAPLPPSVSGRVRLIILVGEKAEETGDQEWLRAASQGGVRVSERARGGPVHV
jgi:hypothetical protein